MITLQLERLNLNAPYFVWRDEDGDLFFKTDEGLLYSVEMDENYETLQYKTCVFGIRNKDKTLSHGDPKLKATVLAIIEEFFLSNHGSCCISVQLKTESKSSVSDCSSDGLTPMSTVTCT